MQLTLGGTSLDSKFRKVDTIFIMENYPPYFFLLKQEIPGRLKNGIPYSGEYKFLKNNNYSSTKVNKLLRTYLWVPDNKYLAS